MYNVTFYALRMAVVCSVCKYAHYLSSKCTTSVQGPLLITVVFSNIDTPSIIVFGSVSSTFFQRTKLIRTAHARHPVSGRYTYIIPM